MKFFVNDGVVKRLVLDDVQMRGRGEATVSGKGTVGRTQGEIDAE